MKKHLFKAFLISLLPFTTLSLAVAAHADPTILDSVLDIVDKAKANITAGEKEAADARIDSVLNNAAPLKTFIDTDGTLSVEEGTADFLEAVKVWQDRVKSTPQFEIVNDPKIAAVGVRFQASVSNEGLVVAGYNTWTRGISPDSSGKYAPVFSAQIFARTIRTGSEALPMSHDLELNTLIHELGHLLGLADSYHYGDVMFLMDFNHPVTSPSDQEVQKLNDWRGELIKLRP